ERDGSGRDGTAETDPGAGGPHGARRNRAARRGIPVGGRQKRRSMVVHAKTGRNPRRVEGEGARAGAVEFLAYRFGARLRTYNGGVCLPRRGDGKGAPWSGDLQLFCTRYRQYGGAR